MKIATRPKTRQIKRKIAPKINKPPEIVFDCHFENCGLSFKYFRTYNWHMKNIHPDYKPKEFSTGESDESDIEETKKVKNPFFGKKSKKIVKPKRKFSHIPKRQYEYDKIEE